MSNVALRSGAVSTSADLPDLGQTRAPAAVLERELETYRRELTGYCYRMLGSGFEAEDAVQETMIRAWRALDSFEGRSAFRSWLYRIATNVCLDMLRGKQRRARPIDLGPASPADPSFLGPLMPEYPWLLPVPDARVMTEGDPAEVAEERETIRLAFVAALQRLPARQRAVLILREVLRWPAAEVAELLETSVASVNSALQRARATLATHADSASAPLPPVEAAQRVLLAKYVDAFERYDMSALIALLREDAVQSMPPYAMWLQGAADIVEWMLGPGAGCRGSRLLPATANGGPAFGQYRVDPEGGHKAWGLQVLEMSAGRVTAITNFLVPELFPAFGLPTHLDPAET
jgi:RNA polymerase sigma-70 factor (ECF subfamily)